MGIKGQAVFEFVIAALMLFAIVVYVITYISANFNVHHERALSDKLEGNALRLSDHILSDSVNGIVKDWPVLSRSGMEDMNNSCAGDNYLVFLDTIGLKESFPFDRFTHLNMTVRGEDGRTYINCGRSPLEITGNARVTRFGVVEDHDQMARIEIILW